MAHISIVGTGSMGQAISGVLTEGGNTVQLLGETDTDQQVAGDIVVLAVPYPAIDQVLAQRGDQLAGKIVIDITNPVNFETFSLAVPADSSAAAEIASKVPGARVLKGFNTTFAATLNAGTVGPLPTTVLVAGDDTEAKATVLDLISAAGLKGIDAGPLSRARELEALGLLQISLAANEKVAWTGGFGVVA